MTTVHSYILHSQWSGTKESVGTLELSNHSTEFSVSTALNGPGKGTNPEELLLAAASSCYMITLASLFTNRNIPYRKIELKSIGWVENDSGLHFDRIEHQPTIYFDEPVTEKAVIRLANHAEHACMVSSALRGNVEVTVRPKVVCNGLQSQV